MAIFYFCEYAKLHLCNKNLGCTEHDYLKLKEKGKITKERLNLLFLLQKYKILTESMLTILTGEDKKALHQELDVLSDFGLVIKQFFEGEKFQTNMRSETFYCAATHLPEEAINRDKKNDFVWSRELKVEDVMKILSFNQFHIALTKYVPKKALQAQTSYKVRDIEADGRYKLKSRKFQMGYSHLFIFSVRDFAAHNVQVAEKMKKIKEFYSYGTEKMPWFILLCENRVQCCNLTRRIKAEADLKDMIVYYILDTDIEYGENPLHILQTYHFANGEKTIVSDNFKVDDWY